MTKSKHTPGPWFSEGTTLYALNDDGMNRFQASFGPGFLTYTKHGDDERTSNEEIMATLTLAKAAPDLLKALELWRDRINGPTEVSMQTLLHMTDAAIAKAKGEE